MWSPAFSPETPIKRSLQFLGSQFHKQGQQLFLFMLAMQTLMQAKRDNFSTTFLHILLNVFFQELFNV